MKNTLVCFCASLCLAASYGNAQREESAVVTARERVAIRLPGAHPDHPALLQDAMQSFWQGSTEQGWEQLRESRSWAPTSGERLVEEAVQIRKVAQYLRETNSYARYREMINGMIARIDEIEEQASAESPKTQVHLYDAIADFHNYIRKDRVKAMSLYERALAVAPKGDVQVRVKLDQLEERYPEDLKLYTSLKQAEALKPENPKF